jgi:hypothetical protein
MNVSNIIRKGKKGQSKRHAKKKLRKKSVEPERGEETSSPKEPKKNEGKKPK